MSSNIVGHYIGILIIVHFYLIYVLNFSSQVAKSYVLATSGALITALSLNKFVKVSYTFIFNLLKITHKDLRN